MIEMFCAGIFTAAIETDQKNAWFLGFSLSRWIIILAAYAVGITIFILGVKTIKKHSSFSKIINLRFSHHTRKLLLALSLFFVLLGWISTFVPSYQFGTLQYIYERLRPISTAWGLINAQFLLLDLFSTRKIKLNSIPSLIKHDPVWRSSIFFSFCLLTLTIFILSTKIGLVRDTPYWNVPGIPLSGLQFLFIILSLSLAIYFFPDINRNEAATKVARIIKLLPVLIYIITILVWGLTPMLKHYFSLEPRAPNFQPYPSSDARIYDRMSIMIINGEENIFQKSTDKPLYIVFLAILHLIGGYDYNLIMWLQIIVLAVIPVIMFYIGKQFDNLLLGVFLAVITIIRQRNAIVLSYEIASANPKLLVTEMLTFLGTVCLILVLFNWLDKNNHWLGLLSGCIIGTLSLTRLNPLILLPAVALFACFAIKKPKANKGVQIIIFILGFIIVFSPWLFIGVNPRTGIPHALFKPINVITNRYLKEPVEFTPTPAPTEAKPESRELPLLPHVNTHSNLPVSSAKLASLIPSKQWLESFNGSPYPMSESNIGTSETIQTTDVTSQGEFSLFVKQFFSHLLHNYATALLSLPDSIQYDDLFHMAEREYWIDFFPWDGSLPPAQIFIILFNVTVIGIGLSYSWQKFQWIGIMPMIIFLSYSIGLSLAITSGSRYIVPIDWILWFYLGLGIIVFLTRAAAFLKGNSSAPEETKNLSNHHPVRYTNSALYTLSFLLLISLSIPIADKGINTRYSDPLKYPQIKSLIQAMPEQANINDDVKIMYGQIQYPYYDENGILSFDLLENLNVFSFKIDISTNPINTILSGGERVILITLEKKSVQSIYLVKKESMIKIWEINSDSF